MINKFKELQNKPEKTKVKIVWISTAFCIVLISIVVYSNLNFKKNTQYDSDKSIFSSFPDLKNEFNNLDNANKRYEIASDEIASEIEKEGTKEIVKNYIENNNFLENGNISNLKFKNIERLENNWIVEYEQFYKDILVYKSSISFVIDNTEKKVISSNSNFDQNIKIENIEPKIIEDEAYALIVVDLEDEDLKKKNSEILIYKDESGSKSQIKYYLAWKINVFSIQSAKEYIYFINADNGKILLLHS
ncbi:MAG: hypothetical protein U9P70_01890 [Patescibacteria group bacterium]|nr:hypothetical protein [Patescibacteria group bacterium]